jgi:hypothetical protein
VDKNYFGDLFADYAQGVQLDIRAKIATDLAKALLTNPNVKPEALAEGCAAMADELLKEFAERGWLKDLPVDGQLPMDARKHLERVTRAQALQQSVGPRLMSEESPVVAPSGPGPLFHGRKQ